MYPAASLSRQLGGVYFDKVHCAPPKSTCYMNDVNLLFLLIAGAERFAEQERKLLLHQLSLGEVNANVGVFIAHILTRFCIIICTQGML